MFLKPLSNYTPSSIIERKNTDFTFSIFFVRTRFFPLHLFSKQITTAWLLIHVIAVQIYLYSYYILVGISCIIVICTHKLQPGVDGTLSICSKMKNSSNFVTAGSVGREALSECNAATLREWRLFAFPQENVSLLALNILEL